MTGHRVVTRHWIIETAGGDALLWPTASGAGAGYNNEIIIAVRRALDGLDPDEADFIGMFYMQGMTYPQIAALIDCPRCRLMSRHRSAVKKLRLRLQESLAGRYHIPAKAEECPLCNHACAAEIDSLVEAKNEGETWRAIIKILKTRFKLDNIKPQTLITHRKYHMP